MIKIKTINVSNPKNVVLQLPKLVVELLDIVKDDKLEMSVGDDGKTIILKKVEHDVDEQTTV